MKIRKIYLLGFTFMILFLLTFIIGCANLKTDKATAENVLNEIDFKFDKGDTKDSVSKNFEMDEKLLNYDFIYEVVNSTYLKNVDKNKFVITKKVEKNTEVEIKCSVRINDNIYSVVKKITLIPPKVSKTEYEITLNLNGGHIDGKYIIDNIKKEKGSSVTLPTPTKEGYDFVDWKKENGEVVKSPFILNENLTLIASYKEKVIPNPTPDPDPNPDPTEEYSVTYDLDGGTLNGNTSIAGHIAKKGEKIKDPGNPTKPDKVFEGWYVDGSKITFPYEVLKNVKLVAKYKDKDPNPNPNPDPEEGDHEHEGNDIPNGYYDSLANKNGEELILELQKILTRMTAISYGAVREALEKTDEDPEKPGYVLGMYDRIHYVNKWTGGDPWNREHVWPNSKLGVPRVKTSEKNQASDLHNLRACEKNINSKRNNHHYVDGQGPTGVFSHGGKWYPGDKDKGDAARILMYMAVRYYGILRLKAHENIVETPTYQAASANMGDLKVLNKFHVSDPVDKFEISRNKKIYKIQKNRNPFIDRPDLFKKVWKFFMDKEGLQTTSITSFNNSKMLIQKNLKAVAGFSLNINKNLM